MLVHTWHLDSLVLGLKHQQILLNQIISALFSQS